MCAARFNNALTFCLKHYTFGESQHRICLLPATSEKDRAVARKHSESIQDYSLQRDACSQQYTFGESRQRAECVIRIWIAQPMCIYRVAMPLQNTAAQSTVRLERRWYIQGIIVQSTKTRPRKRCHRKHHAKHIPRGRLTVIRPTPGQPTSSSLCGISLLAQ
jgi:hypothetical protein